MLQEIFLALIGVYQQYLRKALPACCRFQPSCSEYARQAIAKYGLFWGAGKAAQRILRCHPFSRQAGDDPLI